MAVFANQGSGWAEQDVSARLDYSEDWSDFLVDGDQISASTWEVSPAGLTLSGDSIEGPITTVWASDGAVGVSYRVANRIETVLGRRDVRYFTINVVSNADFAQPVASALFSRARAVEQFKSESLAFLDRSFPVDQITDDYIWDSLIAAESEASHALRVYFAPTVIIPEDAPKSEVDALVAAGTVFRQEPAYDYDPTDWTMDSWGYIIARSKPLIRVDSVKFTYPHPNNTVLDVPIDWVRLDKKYGHIRFVPTGTLMGMGPLTSYLMQAMSSGRIIPNMIHIRYVAGLENVARDYPDLIALVKRMAILRILKSAFLPQSGSISADGLSQSVSVDVDKWQEGIENDLGHLRDSIHGIRFGVL